jgi:hypothetical protein
MAPPEIDHHTGQKLRLLVSLSLGMLVANRRV